MKPSSQDYSWLDGTFHDAASNGPEFTVTAGETSSVNVWHNVSEPAQTVTDPNDVQANPCANAANPCAQDRTVLVYQNTYTYRGVIKGDGPVLMGPIALTRSVSLQCYLDSNCMHRVKVQQAA